MARFAGIVSTIVQNLVRALTSGAVDDLDESAPEEFYMLTEAGEYLTQEDGARIILD